MIPVRVDWPLLFFNLKREKKLTIKHISRETHVSAGTLKSLKEGHETRYSNAVPVLNLHMRELPDVPIPELKDDLE